MWADYVGECLPKKQLGDVSKEARMTMIMSADKTSTEASGLSVRRQCELLEVPRSTHYYRQKSLRLRAEDETSQESDETLKVRIEAVALEYPKYGYRRITKELRDRHPKDSPSNHKRVLRMMRESGLLCKQKAKAKPYNPASQPSSIPNLLRDESVIVTAPNQVWQADLTYITLGAGFIYLAAILDAFTRKCIGWALSQKPDQQLTLAALKMALEQHKGCLESNPNKLIHHSDQGVQYTADAYIDLLLQNHIRPSLSRRGRPTDNAKAESFFKTFKYEEVYLKEYDSIEDAQNNIQHFIEQVYNTKRLHSALGYLSPNNFEMLYHQNQRLASAVV
jgi:transposase InsO family protein